GTDAIIYLMEEIRDGQRFRAVCQRLLHLDKPLIACKLGRTEAGGAAVHSHTGSLTGSYRALQAVFRQNGVIEAPDLDAVIDLVPVVASRRWPGGDRVAVMTVSGGVGAAAADAAEEAGLRVPPFGEQTQQQLR